MSSLVIDIVIWILLITGLGFGLIGLIGLLLFPDTRSRMFTAVRASLISIGATAIAVFVYGFNALQTSGGNQYSVLILRTVLLVIVVIIGNYIVSSTILKKPWTIVCNPSPKEKSRDEGDKK
jgi:multicomponent Na+:H+ antiporter subunit G